MSNDLLKKLQDSSAKAKKKLKNKLNPNSAFGTLTDEEIAMFNIQFGEGMYDKITGLSLYDYD